MPNHTVESMKYITTLPDIDRERANEVLTAASRLVGTEELDKLIKIGASEGTKVTCGSVPFCSCGLRMNIVATAPSRSLRKRKRKS